MNCGTTMVIVSFGWRLINNLFQIFQQRFDKKTEGRIENDQARSLAPGLPLLLDFLGLRRIDRNMDGSHIIRKKFCIAQRFQRALVNSADRA